MLHSLLFIPAIEKRLAKVDSVEADAVIIDLEDSIREEEKDAALERAAAFFKGYQGKTKCFARVNRSRLDAELRALSPLDSVLGFMIPKMESPDVLSPYADLLANKKTIALVETPMGVVNIEKIVASDKIDYVALGAEDLTCAMNQENSFDVLYHARSRLVLYSKAYGKRVYDTPSFNYKYEETLRAEVQSLVAMGFDGKLCIHPMQVPVVNELFMQYDVDSIKEIVEAFENSQEGVLVYKGKVYEKPHVNHLKNILKTLEEEGK